jgi:threonine/homoserine/homoserine lactone efflux protein
LSRIIPSSSTCGSERTVADLLPAWPVLIAFLGVSLILAVVPGPGVAYIVARSVTAGRRTGLVSVAGVAAGNLGNAVAASLGLAAILAVSSTAFLALKYAGAAYLVWLGLRALRRDVVASVPESGMHRIRPRHVLRDGFLVALLNPKTMLFFGSFLPQFMAADAASPAQGILLGALFVAVAAVTDTAYALAAAAVAPLLRGRPGLQGAGRRLRGGALVGLGLYTACSDSHAPQTG